jgi:hypothetical protein
MNSGSARDAREHNVSDAEPLGLRFELDFALHLGGQTHNNLRVAFHEKYRIHENTPSLSSSSQVSLQRM